MTTRWKFIRFNRYTLEMPSGAKYQINLNHFARGASFQLEGSEETWHLKISGFLRNRIDVKNMKDREVLVLESPKWWKSSWEGTLGKLPISISLRNNPLVEYVASVQGVECLSYGMKISGNLPVLSIQQVAALPPHGELLQLVLFVMIRPILMETMGHKIRMEFGNED